MILAFEENEENILNRILSCISKETDVLKHEVIQKGELSFKGLYIDKYKRIVGKCSIVGTFNKSLNCGKIRLYESY